MAAQQWQQLLSSLPYQSIRKFHVEAIHTKLTLTVNPYTQTLHGIAELLILPATDRLKILTLNCVYLTIQ